MLAEKMEKLFSSIPATDGLRPVPGNGSLKPVVGFVFINPTYRNISASPGWKGPSYPFIGTKQWWNVLFRAGILPEHLASSIVNGWDEELAQEVLSWMEQSGIWITNVVKTAYNHSRIPDMATMRAGASILMKELEILKPKFIVAMGAIPFRMITGKSIKLSEAYESLMRGRPLSETVGSSTVLPCYFPVGRGNPKRAEEMLRTYSNIYGWNEFFHKK